MKAALRRILFSIVTRNIVTFLVILTLVVVPLVYRYLGDVEKLMSDTISVQLAGVAELGRFLLNAEEVDQVRNLIWYETNEYENMVRTLTAIQRNFSVDNAVLMRRLPNGRFVYMADGNRQFEINQPAQVHNLFPETYPPAAQAWETGTVGQSRLFESGANRWFQINVPLKVGNRVVALLLLNKFATPIAVAIEQRQREIVLGMSLALAGGIVVWWFLTSRSLRPLIRLQQASREIAAGNLEIEIPANRSRSEIGELSRSFRTMVGDLRASRAEIEEYSRTLEGRIEERTQEIQGLLDNMDEGIFTIDSEGAINPRFSAATEHMLGATTAKGNFIERLSPDPDTQKTVRETFRLLVSGAVMVDWDDMVAGLPNGLPGEGGSQLRARYRPVYDTAGARTERVMVILQDVTQEKALQEDIDRNRDLHNMVVQIIQNRETFDMFYQDALTMLGESAGDARSMALVSRGVVDRMFRTLHTIKGTAGLFGMHEAATRAHEVEDTLRDLNQRRDEAYSEEERRTLAGGIDQVRQLLIEGKKTFLELIGEEDSEPNYTIAESKIDRISEELLTTVNAQTAEAIRPVLARLKRVPTGRLVRKYKTLVESTAERLGKQARFELRDKDGTEVPVDYFQKLDPTFLHIIRNAIDHGIEGVEQRLEAGKEPIATIALTTEYRDGGVIFSISDDGRGIDTEQIRAIGLERGFIKPGQAKGMSRKDVLRLLFLPAFSSRDSVSELSGRGVGLDVVRTDVERMHGRMRLVTRKGRGTTFHLYYPLPV